jgi:hypothetical protein
VPAARRRLGAPSPRPKPREQQLETSTCRAGLQRATVTQMEIERVAGLAAACNDDGLDGHR